MDLVRIQADRSYNKTLLHPKFKNSELYTAFFSSQNFYFIIDRIEKEYDVNLSESYRRDVFDTMLKCFQYHPENFTLLNALVFTELRPKLTNLIMDQKRYKTNMYEIAESTCIHPIEFPEHICNRKESLILTDAMFGVNDKNILAFQRFKTG